MRNLRASYVLLTWLMVLAVRPAAAQVQTTPEGVTLNFQNVELVSVLTALGQAAGINVISSNVPSTQVTLRTAEPMAPDAIAVLVRELAWANGMVVIEEGGFLLLQGPLAPEATVLPPRQLYIHRLQHARAFVLASTLQALFGGSPPQPNAGPQVSQTLSQQLQTLELQSAQGATGINTGTQAQTQAFVGATGELEGNVQIIPDEVTNSLLVRATEEDWGIIQQAILALDLRPLHVVIEVIIAEVRQSEGLDLGLSFTATDQGPGEGESTTATLPGTPGPDDFTLQVLRTGDVDVSATLSALASTGNVRILSRPVIQAQNNVEARILVGSERPFVQVTQSSTIDVGGLQQVVQYRDVGTALTILPTINEDGYVNLVLSQEVSSATAEEQFGAPVISTREATTQLLALSGQTVVIGGLVDQQTEETRSGIPLLKDIPILGFLFGRTSESVVNSELFLFLTPYVVASDQDAETLRQEIEGNVELLRELMPLRSLLPPSLRSLLPDSVGADTLGAVPPDTLQADALGGSPPDTLQADTLGAPPLDSVQADTLDAARPDSLRADTLDAARLHIGGADALGGVTPDTLAPDTPLAPPRPPPTTIRGNGRGVR